MKTGNIRIVDRAEVPEYPIKPKKKLNILLAIIVSLLTGTGLAFFFEYLDNTIKLPEEVEKHLNIPFLGSTPLFSTKNKWNIRGDTSPELIAFNYPRSTASESYRGIRTNILFSSAESVPQVILIQSLWRKPIVRSLSSIATCAGPMCIRSLVRQMITGSQISWWGIVI
jgi:hypothetical protein